MTKIELGKRVSELKKELDSATNNHNGLSNQFSNFIETGNRVIAYLDFCIKRDLKTSSDEQAKLTGKFEEASKMLSELFNKECEDKKSPGSLSIETDLPSQDTKSPD